MMNKSAIIILVIFLQIFNISCKRGVYLADFKIARGYVIGREVCNIDEAKDYWLIDLTFSNITPQYGDTLAFQGNVYNNVVKVATLAEPLKKVGISVRFDFKRISDERFVTNNCNVAIPDTYLVKELFILSQSEIR